MAVTLIAGLAFAASAKYPAKTITFVAPSGAGGAFDMALRSIRRILGPMLENNVRRGLTGSNGDFTIFLTRPVSAVLLTVAVLWFSFRSF